MAARWPPSGARLSRTDLYLATRAGSRAMWSAALGAGALEDAGAPLLQGSARSLASRLQVGA